MDDDDGGLLLKGRTACSLKVTYLFFPALVGATSSSTAPHISQSRGIAPRNSIEGYELNGESHGMAGFIGVNINVVGGKVTSSTPLYAICCWDRSGIREGHA